MTRKWVTVIFLGLLPFAVLAQKKYIPDEPLERMDDPPLEAGPQLLSPAGDNVFGPYVSHQVNVNAGGANILGDAANEPSIWVDPNNRNRMAVGWRQFNNVASNFRQSGYGYSSNGGATWTFPGVLENNVFRSDPVLCGDGANYFYYLSLLQSFFDDLWRSTNFGQNYANLGPATGGDKEWFTVDRTASSGHGFIYQAWSTAGNNYNGRQFSRSTNGGASWMNPINLPNQPVWGTMDIGPNGELYICGTDGGLPSMRFLRSSNAKNSAVTPSFDMSVFVDLGADITYGIPVNPEGLGGQVWIACDRGYGPYRGRIYLLCSVSNGDANNPLDVKMRYSGDGGTNWAPVIRINDDPLNGGKYHWFGTLSVAPSGRVDVIWNDTRQSAGNTMSALYYSYSLNGGQTFTSNVQVSNQFNQSLGYPNQNKMGDYIGMISDNGGADIAYTATFNGEQDVYHLRLTAPTLTISGRVVLGDWIGAVAGRVVTFQVRNAAGDALVDTKTAILASDGSYSFSTNAMVIGSYQIAAKASHWLRKATPATTNAAGASGVNFTLTNGDISTDNEIDIADYSMLSAAYNSFPGDPNWNVEADLNGDEAVDIADYSILSAHYGDSGD